VIEKRLCRPGRVKAPRFCAFRKQKRNVTGTPEEFNAGFTPAFYSDPKSFVVSLEFDEPKNIIASPQNIGPRNNGIIPSEGPPDITDLNPKVRKQ